ncbi:MAG: hypothetical protein V4724_06030 [Pseudomonadota bacterium]
MNTVSGSAPPTRKTLALCVAAAAAAATLLMLAVILPAEFHYDPLGIGKATGLLGLSAPAAGRPPPGGAAVAAAVARFYPGTLRSDTVVIPLAAAGDRAHGDEREWKVRMRTGQTLVYSWTVAAPEGEFYADFHGQSDPVPKVLVQSYRQGMETASHGALTAPFDGIHGWFLQNQSARPVVVHLTLSGFYNMRPDPYAPE